MANADLPTPKKDYLPKDKRLRLAVQLLIAAVGLYAIVSGIRQIMEAC